MKRDSLGEKIERNSFVAKLLHECRGCHAVGLRPGAVEVHFPKDRNTWRRYYRKYKVLRLNEDGLCPECSEKPPA